MIIDNERAVTDAVLTALSRTPNPRLRAIYTALARNLHDVVREVELTQDELEAAVAFLADLGHYTNETRNEMMQASDVLGISSLVSLLHHPLSEVETAAAVMGPFYRAKPAPWCEPGESMSRGGDEGTPLSVIGQCSSVDGRPLEGVVIDAWQASPSGVYDCQDPSMLDMDFRGKYTSAADGSYHLATLRPAGYPVPTDGPIGRLLESQDRHAFRPAHIHFIVSHPEHETLITQLYIDEQQALEEDVVFGVTTPLVGTVRPASRGQDETVIFDFRLKPGVSTLPVPPIP